MLLMEPVKGSDEWLRREYVERLQPAPAIARELGCSSATVYRRLGRIGVHIRPKNEAMQLARGGRIRGDDVEVRAGEMYRRGYSGNEIAHRLRIGKSEVFAMLERQGVPRRSKREATINRRNTAGRVRPRASELRAVSSTCAACGTDRFIEYHHISGDATDNTPENLIALCWEHHVLLEYLIHQALVGYKRRFLNTPTILTARSPSAGSTLR